MWAVGVTALYELHPDQVGVHMSPIPHQLMSTALGLLLVFRTNAVSRFDVGDGWLGTRLS